MFDNLCKSWPRESQQCINRLKNKQTSYRVLNTVLIKVLYERCGSWPQKCYGDGYSTGWLRHFIATRPYEFFNFRSAETRSDHEIAPFTAKTYLREMVWHFIGVYIVDRKLHGRLRYEISQVTLKNISLVCWAHSWNIFQHSKRRNLVSLRGHVISPTSFLQSYYMLWAEFW